MTQIVKLWGFVAEIDPKPVSTAVSERHIDINTACQDEPVSFGLVQTGMARLLKSDLFWF